MPRLPKKIQMTTTIVLTFIVIFFAVLLKKKRHRKNPKFEPSAASRTFSRNPKNKKCLDYCQIGLFDTPRIIMVRMRMVSFYGRVVECTGFISSIKSD